MGNSFLVNIQVMLILMNNVDARVWIPCTFIRSLEIVHRHVVESDASGQIHVALLNPVELDGTLSHIYHFEGIFLS